MHRLRIPFQAVEPGVDERPPQPMSPLALVRWAAAAKAAAVGKRFPRAVVLGADTMVVLDGIALGKPSGADDARRMLRSLSGRTHVVYTAVHAINTASAQQASGVSRTRVTMRRLSAAEIDRYVASGEVQDKAGAYAIQAGGGSFVERIDGPLDNVVGMPLRLVRRVLRKCGVQVRAA